MANVIAEPMLVRIGRYLRYLLGGSTAVTPVRQVRTGPRPVMPTRAPAPAAPPPVRKFAAHEVFTPTKPRAGRATLVGRQVELSRILEALTQESAHVVIYAERGRGKTSLANLAVERLRRAGITVGRHACDASSTFDSIMHGVMRDLPESLLSLEANGMVRSDGKGCSTVLPRGALQPDDIAAIPGRLACNSLVFLLDEFDRVQDQPTRTRLADTMKLLSDRGAKLQFMVVGVSSTLEQIIGQHPSIQRNIAAVHLPLMEDREIEALLESGGKAAGFTFSPGTRVVVTGIARGMPYMAQLLGLRIIQQCVADGASETSRAHVIAAIERVIADAPSDLVGRYGHLTSGPDGHATESALLTVAKAPHDRWGRFSVPPSVDPAQVKRLIEERVVEPAPHAGRGKDAPLTLQYAERPLIFHVLLLHALNHLKVVPAVPDRLVAANG